MKDVYVAVILISFLFSIPSQAVLNDPAECQEFIKNLPQQYQRGYVTVPEDYAKPSGPQIEIFWYSKKKPGQTPVAFFHGGPAATDRYSYNAFSTIEDRFNLGIIYFDQRGNGCSTNYIPVTDSQTASKASLYNSENIARDAEEVRKAILGKNKRWKIFGQSYGGWIVERYLAIFPKSVSAAYSFAGVLYERSAEELAGMLYSQHKSLEKLESFRPGTKNKIALLRKLFEGQCVVFNNQNVCGRTILSLVARTYLTNATNWGKFLGLIADPTYCQEGLCMFDKDFRINQDFFIDFAAREKFIIDAFWGGKEDLFLTTSIFSQEQMSENPKIPSLGHDCSMAETLLKSKYGVLAEELSINECDILRSSYGQISDQDYFDIFSKVPIRNTFSTSKLRESLKKNKSLRYIIYNGDLDFLFANYKAHTRQLTNQVIYKRFPMHGHYGYLDEVQVWRDISGLKNQTLIGESASYIIEGQKTQFEKVGQLATLANFPTLSGLTAQLIHVGRADEPFSPELQAQVKGKIALVDRGVVSFGEKAKRVQDAGAVGLMIANNVLFNGQAFNSAIDPAMQIVIPGLIISTDDGAKLKDILKNKKSVEIQFSYFP